MNNKEVGTDFEEEVCAILQKDGYWVHFITPDKRGAQPFDIIAIKNGEPLAIECKTLAATKKSFPLSRLQDNQILAFNRWIKCGNPTPQIWVRHGDTVKVVQYKSAIAVEEKYTIKVNMENAREVCRL